MSPSLYELNIHGRRTAYAYFVQSCRELYEHSHPNETPNFTEFIRNCQARWDNLPDLEKAPFQALAEADKVRYNNELLQHGITPPSEEPPQSRKRKQYEHTHPRQPLSAFYWFCNDQRSIVMSENPALDQGQAAMEMGKRWIASSPADKHKYEVIAETERKRYDKAMAEYKRK